jgi:purine-cytosine permease-like protein
MAPNDNAMLRLEKTKRHYHKWVVNETLEDYSLRFAPQSFRKWSEFEVFNTALGGISYLADFAIGGSIAISAGFTNSLWAILVSAVIIFFTGWPIAYYASKYNIDMDLLTRGAGFGYFGSTLTSVVYASFCFIFFALEGAIMAQALELWIHLPLWLGYFICTIVIFPLVVFGMSLLAKLQTYTQVIWLVGMILPWVMVLVKDPNAMDTWTSFAGKSPTGNGFNLLACAAACSVPLSLIAQIGEQVDYLRFMPNKTEQNSGKWWAAVIGAGPGWVIVGAWKQLAGAFFTAIAVKAGVDIAKANEPIQMYVQGFSKITDNPAFYIALAALFVLLSQVKINVTNAYSGSLSWSNFFSRLTHKHPGRVVWLVFHLIIALTLMELKLFDAILWVLGFYSNVAIAWVGALTADLVINKPLGLSPSYIEFKRAHLYNFNPVGFGSMCVASVISIIAFFGAMGPAAQAFSVFIALIVAFILSPIVAVITKGKYYIARKDEHFNENSGITGLTQCSICEFEYEREDMAYCPVYDVSICSLCCSLDADCHDSCKCAPA